RDAVRRHGARVVPHGARRRRDRGAPGGPRPAAPQGPPTGRGAVPHRAPAPPPGRGPGAVRRRPRCLREGDVTMELTVKPGTRLFSAVDDTEVVVVRAPAQPVTL